MPGAASGYLPPVIAQIGATDADFISTLTDVEGLLAQFASTNTQTQLGATLAPLEADLGLAKAQLLQFAKQLTNANLGVDAAPFWAEITALRAEMAAMSPLDINVDANVATALAKIAALRAELSGAQTDALLSAFGSGGGGDGGGAAGAAAGGAAAGGTNALVAALGLGGMTTFIHVAHLFMPEIIGVITAISSVVIGFGALGIASIGAATDIMNGFSAVSTAQNSIQAAIPGTTQWSTAVVSLGQAWSTIPTALQPAVSAINNLMQSFGSTPLSQEIQGFLGAQLETIGSLFSKSGNTFEPLILAAEQAMDTVEGIFSKSMGGGALTTFVDSISKMVGPASVELAQIVIAVLKIGAGFAKAVQDGQGMEVIVNLFQTLATVVGSPLFSAFIAGWVDFDRIISVVLGLLIRGVGAFAQLSGQVQGLGLVLGFVISGMMAVKSAMYLAGMAGIQSAKDFTLFGSSINGILLKGAGIGLIAVGITGLAGNVATLLHTSNPLTTVWNALGRAIGVVSHAATGSISTINGYKVQLSGAIPITKQLSTAMDLLVRSEQSIGSSLVAASTGFAQFSAAVPMSYAKMIANLNSQNTALAQWAADAQKLIKAGVDPSMVATMVQQSPAEVVAAWGAVQKSGVTAIDQMKTTWDEHMMEMGMSGQTGIQGMITKMVAGLKSGSPTMVAAAKALATTLGTNLNIPFTGSVASIQAIGKALNTLPKSVLATMAGQLGKVGTAANDTASSTKKVHAAAQGLMATLASVGVNVVMLGAGLKLLNVAETATQIKTFAVTAATTVWSGVTTAATAVQGAFDAVLGLGLLPLLLIVGGIAAVIAIGVLLITHWKQVTAAARTVWTDVSGYFVGLWHSVTSSVGSLVTSVVSFFEKLPGRIKSAIGDAGTMLFNIGKQIVQGLINGVTGMIGHAVNAVKSLAGGLLGAVKGVLGIFSPSSEFAYLGTMIGQGLAVGITGGTGHAIAAATGLARQVVAAGQMGLSPQIGGASFAGSGGTGGVNISAPINVVVAGPTSATAQGIGTAVRQEVNAAMSDVLRQLQGGARVPGRT